jgi:hypothetical protein
MAQPPGPAYAAAVLNHAAAGAAAQAVTDAVQEERQAVAGAAVVGGAPAPALAMEGELHDPTEHVPRLSMFAAVFRLLFTGWGGAAALRAARTNIHGAVQSARRQAFNAAVFMVFLGLTALYVQAPGAPVGTNVFEDWTLQVELICSTCQILRLDPAAAPGQEDVYSHLVLELYPGGWGTIGVVGQWLLGIVRAQQHGGFIQGGPEWAHGQGLAAAAAFVHADYSEAFILNKLCGPSNELMVCWYV